MNTVRMHKKKFFFVMAAFFVLVIGSLLLFVYKNSQTEIVHQNGILQKMSIDELVQNSALIVQGKISNHSEPFVIRPVWMQEGQEDPSDVFMDYYVEVDHVLRGNAETQEAITVRIRGGKKDGLLVYADQEPRFETGEEYILFLYQPNAGGGYNTDPSNGAYYYVTGAHQGAFLKINEDGFVAIKPDVYKTQSMSFAQVSQSGDVIHPNSFYQDVLSQYNNRPIDEAFKQKQDRAALKNNLDSGMITKEEYQEAIQEENQYATVVK